MNLSEFKALIVVRVRELNGVKAMDLVMDKKILDGIRTLKDDGDFPVILEEMVKEGMIAEVEFCFKGEDRLRSFYLPKGSSIQVKCGNHGCGLGEA